ncbi:ABC-type nitrate/sulfonate/bicarbonate transport system substrate-binding protein [Actinomadura pelletieri DSM 43383]|uniref:ABC-type nitrate/sulfonate/bicarbonate transport system substrate-binding protein n=1 Tax=Actinomadura pelletieri DSM 43383 TaxID=1120940 RepID=A0A495QKX6_9ACTN|nr:ABC transporter substrate-binding protein [Actinomadura pelletieri]RKS73158.1 ABC-type nitrate/sulfonate/bicarbonate transport system substrate-binding protein [Actinomadura pelletieri DSM 43383]
MKRTMRAAFTASVAAVVAVGLAGCGSGGGDGKSGPDVRIGQYAGFSLFDAPTYAAFGTGLMDKAARDGGFSAQRKTVGNGTDLVAGMMSGAVDFGVLPAATVMAVNAKRGAPVLKMVSCTFDGAAIVFVGAAKYERSRGDDITAYDGGNWGYSKVGSQSEILGRLVADKVGIGWKNQKGIALGPVTAYVPALKTGRVDMIMTDATGAALALEQKAGYVVHNTNGSGRYFAQSAACNGVATTAAFAKKHPKVVDAVVRAQEEARRKLLNTESGALLQLMTPDFRRSAAEGFPRAWELFAPAVRAADTNPVDAQVKAAVEYARIQGVPNPDPKAVAVGDGR